jgi:hypothetical protein
MVRNGFSFAPEFVSDPVPGSRTRVAWWCRLAARQILSKKCRSGSMAAVVSKYVLMACRLFITGPLDVLPLDEGLGACVKRLGRLEIMTSDSARQLSTRASTRRLTRHRRATGDPRIP